MKIDWPLFRFAFDDPRWKGKFAIGGLLMLIAVFLSFPFFWLVLPVEGYGLRVMRRTLKGEPPALPEWEGWGDLFSSGLKAWVIRFVYLLPVIVLVCCIYGMWLAFAFSTPFMIGGARAVPRAAAGGMVASIFFIYAVSFVLFGIVFALSLPLSFLSNVATSRFAATDSLGSAFQLGEVWGLARRGFKNYALAYIIYFAAALGAGMIAVVLMYTIILACLYPFALAGAMIYAQVMLGALFGMAYYHTMNPSAEPARDAPALPQTKPLHETQPGLPASVERTEMSDKTPLSIHTPPEPMSPPRAEPSDKPRDAGAKSTPRRRASKKPPAES